VIETAWSFGETYGLLLQVHIPESGDLYFDRSDSVQPRRGKGSSWPGLRY